MIAKPLIFTDMDGTLLDHYSYSYAAAEPMLQRLAEASIAVIPTTSKTAAEVEVYRQKMSLDGPFIIENGAAAYWPERFFPEVPEGAEKHGEFWRKAFARPRQYWIDKLKPITAQYSGEIEHFASMTIQDIQRATGLDAESAELAAQREFGEPILWNGADSRKAMFMASLASLGTTPLEGGRFIHLGDRCDKGSALVWLATEYRKQFQLDNVTTIALGDGNNDIAMLEAADIAVRIASPVHNLPDIKKNKNNYTSSKFGPEGWAEVIQLLLFADT